MWYRCRSCRHEVERGCLPAASCGLYAIILLGFSAGAAAVLVERLRGRFAAPGSDSSTPWWAEFGSPVLVLVLGIVGAIAINLVLQLVEYLAFVWRKCPGCGARRWSWGFTRGFGL